MKINCALLDSTNTTELAYPVQGQLEILVQAPSGKIMSAQFRVRNDDGTLSAPVPADKPSFIAVPDGHDDPFIDDHPDTTIEWIDRDLLFPGQTMAHFYPHPDSMLPKDPEQGRGPAVTVFVNGSGQVEINWPSEKFGFVPLKGNGRAEFRYLGES